MGITKIKSIGSAITSFLHVDDLVTKVNSAAGQIGDAFNKGYGDKLDSERPKQVAAHQQHLDKKKSAEQTAANQMADIVTASDQKALNKKAVQADKHRLTEAKKAADADANKRVAEMNVNAIKDELERDKAKLTLKYQNELANINQSKASRQVKATWEKALYDQLQRDIDKTEEDHRKKKEKEETETAKRILDLKIKLSGDEKADKLQKLEDVASAQRIQIQKDITDETQKASMLKQVNDNLIRDKEAVEQPFLQ